MTPLRHALLGLVHRAPASGYDLRRLFEDTPMSVFSSSPGAIYPALAALEKAGWIRGRVEKSGEVRARKVYRSTAAGRRELARWLREPIESDDVARRPELLDLRLALMDGVLGLAEIAAFADGYRTALEARVEALERHAREHAADYPLPARLALEAGLAVTSARAAWADRACRALQRRVR